MLVLADDAIDIIKYFTDSHNIFICHLKVVQAICVWKIVAHEHTAAAIASPSSSSSSSWYHLQPLCKRVLVSDGSRAQLNRSYPRTRLYTTICYQRIENWTLRTFSGERKRFWSCTSSQIQ